MKRCTLQIRLMVIVGLILLSSCLLLTANSLLAARTYYGDYAMLIESGLAEIDPAWHDEIQVDQALVVPDGLYQYASNRFSVQMVLGMALIVALGLAATYFATGRMLRPLKELTRSVRAVDDRNLDRRVPLEKARGEALALSESFNRMLDRLEDAFLVQKRFASDAAHELKTTLAVIKSSLQVLEMNPDPQTEDYREFMQNTGASLERIIETVDGLLALANLSAASTDEPVELGALLAQAVEELAAPARAAGVDLALTVRAEAAVRGNSSLLYRALFNLIENAVKYNRPGGTVAVLLEGGGEKAVISVRDTGVGIEADALRHVFEPFYRADPSRSQSIPGSGLGLAIVKSILDRHGGRIEAASEAGRGSTFTVTLNAQPSP